MQQFKKFMSSILIDSYDNICRKKFVILIPVFYNISFLFGVLIRACMILGIKDAHYKIEEKYKDYLINMLDDINTQRLFFGVCTVGNVSN